MSQTPIYFISDISLSGPFCGVLAGIGHVRDVILSVQSITSFFLKQAGIIN